MTAKNLTGPTMAAVNAEVDKTSAKMKTLNKTAALAAAGFALVGVEAVKMASKFDSEMSLLQTQAGVSADKIDGLKKGVLDLAGKVGQDPDSLAESLFHVESNFESMGISSKKALDLVKISAEGATVGHADLVDVTNALTAAVASGIPGVQNMGEAMGTLNAIVGVGDMKMSDLAKAFGSGMVATVKGFGLSITDVGAALAVFGDNNIRGSNAATQLRMSVMAMAKPVQGGADALKSIGLETDTLAKDMQKGGLKVALEDLVAHLNAAGISSKQQGQIITDAFGRKAGAGLNILVGQMDRLESKYPALEKGAKGFGKSFADTQKTFAFQMKSLQASFDALMIGVGEKIIPPLQGFIHLLAEHKRATIDATIATAGLLAALVAVSVTMKAVAATKMAWAGISKGLTALRGELVMANSAFLTAGGGLKGLSAGFAALSTKAKVGVAVVAIGAVVMALDKLSSSGKKAPDVDRMATALGNLATSGKSGGELTKAFGTNLSGLADDIDKLNGKKDGLDHFNDVMNAVFTLGMKGSNGPKKAKQDLDSIDKGLAQLVTGGHAEEARAALTKLYAAGAKVPIDKLDNYNAALDATKLQSDLTADAQGRFGKQAEQVQQQLQAQKDVADGLAQSLQALDQINQDSYNSETKFYDSISAATQALKDNGKTLNVHTDAGRKNRDALSAIAASTDDYTQKLTAQNAGMDKIDAAYTTGYDSLVKAAEGFGLGATAAKKLADSLLHVPQEVKVQGNIDDLETKLKSAKAQLKSVPPSKKAKLLGDIADLERKIAAAKRELAGVVGKTVGINIVTTHSDKGSVAHEGGQYKAAGGFVSGPGTGTSDEVPIMASNGEFVVNAKAAQAHRGLLQALNSGRHGVAAFAKGGTVSKAQQAAIDRATAEHSAAGEAMGSLNISYFGRLAGYKTSSFQNTMGAPSGLGDLAQSLNDWASKIRAATHGAQESKLIRDFDRFGAAALKNEKSLLAVNSKLSAASDKLSALKDAASQLKDSVSSGIVSGGSIAKGGAGNALGVVEQLQGSVDSAKRFAADLAKLKASGLNSQSLSELAQAGVDGGLGTADALAGASPAYLKRINDLEKQLIAAGGSAGSTAAASVYGAGIKTAQGIVDGLKKQQSKLDSIMAHAAAAMAAELKRALGRKGAGGVVGAAAAGGARWGRTLVGEYGPEIADLPVGTRVHSAPDTARMLGGAAPVQPIALTVVIGGTTVGTALIDPLRKEIRQQGGNVQLVLGVRGKG
ncbi:phage tail tape measure protein [Streptomyces sp. V4-01]|uniref:Phage tail tape measure protein n=1 Tax=Actinacidiphila polyblastidii TaxID=3110430 RepID=A0ABU7PKU8_9ACTN|nr:phage tail tape measure protein [Streptomyces sp. V4-01]